MMTNSAKIDSWPSWLRWLMLVISGLFVTFNSAQMHMFNALAPALMHTYHIKTGKLGILSSFYFIGLILISLPTGLLLDRYSNLLVTLMGLLLNLIGLTLFALAPTIGFAELGRFLAGIGGSVSFLCTLVLAARWFELRRFAYASAIVIVLYSLGGFLSQQPTHYLLQLVGWRNTVFTYIGIGIVLFILISLSVYDSPTKKIMQPNFYTSMSHKLRSIPTEIRQILGNSQLWLASIFNWGLVFPSAILGALFGQLYLTKVFHLTASQAAAITSIFFVGLLIGALTSSWCSDKLQIRKPFLLLGAMGSLILSLIVVYAHTLSITQLYLLFMGIGFFANFGILSHALIVENTPINLIGVSQAIAGVIIMSAYVIAQPLTGWLLEVTHSNYSLAFILLPITTVITLIAALLINETYSKRVRSEEEFKKSITKIVSEQSPQRFYIMGGGGTGKSSLALAISRITKIPVIHLDFYYWKQGWVTPSARKLIRLKTQLQQQNHWIVEGAKLDLLDDVSAQADIIIFLDFPPVVCVWRAIKRALYTLINPKLAKVSGCPVKIHHLNSFRWIWNYHRYNLMRINKILTSTSVMQKTLRITSNNELNNLRKILTNA